MARFDRKIARAEWRAENKNHNNRHSFTQKSKAIRTKTGDLEFVEQVHKPKQRIRWKYFWREIIKKSNILAEKHNVIPKRKYSSNH